MRSLYRNSQTFSARPRCPATWTLKLTVNHNLYKYHHIYLFDSVLNVLLVVFYPSFYVVLKN